MTESVRQVKHGLTDEEMETIKFLRKLFNAQKVVIKEEPWSYPKPTKA